MDDDAQGVDAEVTQAYLALLSHPDADREQLANILGVDHEAVGTQLSTLAQLGSIKLHADGRWHVPPPDVTLPARAGELERVARQMRAAAGELTTIYHQARAERSGEATIEMLRSDDEVHRYFLEVMSSARNRVRSLDRAPFLDAAQALTDVQVQQSANGVRFLSVYDPTVLEAPESLVGLRDLAATGEQIRVLRGIPMKITIADDEMALVMVRTLEHPWRGSMLVRRSSFLDCLVQLFETMWRLGVPLPRAGGDADTILGADDAPAARDRQVLLLLAGGTTDETIARQLGLSTRTVERRVRALLDRLGADTRFQAGVQAARRGWL